MSRRRTGMKRGLTVVVMALGLVAGACGNATDGGGGSATGDLPRLPGAASSAARSAGAVAESGAAMAADASQGGGAATGAPAPDIATEPAPPYEVIEYRLAGGLPSLGGKAPAYRLEADVDRATVEKVAAAFGVEGDPKEENGQWSVGSDGNAGRFLSISPDGSFNVFDPSQESVAVASDVAVACSSEGPCDAPAVEPTPPPPPPADLPTNDDAEAAARDLFDAAGVSLGSSVKVERSDYNVIVAFPNAAEGVAVEGAAYMASFGSKGALQFANGSVARPSKVGDYPLVDTKAAWERSNMNVDASQREVLLERAGAPSDATPVRRVVEIDRAERVLMAQYGRCQGDPVYLVPAYQFFAGEELVAVVPAVASEYLDPMQGLDAPQTDDATYEPCPGEEGKAEPAREPDRPTDAPDAPAVDTDE